MHNVTVDVSVACVEVAKYRCIIGISIVELAGYNLQPSLYDITTKP